MRVRYGYRRIHVLLRREGCHHGQNKTCRIYRELGLQLRNKNTQAPATRLNKWDSRQRIRVDQGTELSHGIWIDGRIGGLGWQDRINDALRKLVEKKA